MASCVHVPQYPVHEFIYNQRFQMKTVRGVNKVFWREFNNVTLEFDCPSPPAIVVCRCYENYSLMPSTDPIFEVAGYLATCAAPTPGLGTALWFWMATLGISWGGKPHVPVDYIHLQNYKSNVGSIGWIPYPHMPPS